MWDNQIVPQKSFSRLRLFLCVHSVFFIFIASLCFFPLNTQAGEVTLAWDPPSTEYAGFILSYGTSSRSYSENLDIGGKTTYTVSNLHAGQTYFFSIKAYDSNHTNESLYSSEVNTTIPALDTTAPAFPKDVIILSGR